MGENTPNIPFQGVMQKYPNTEKSVFKQDNKILLQRSQFRI
jgi:hypothetical protein